MDENKDSEDAPLLSRQDSKTSMKNEEDEVQEMKLSVKIRHSKWYILLTLLQIVLSVTLFLWIIIEHKAFSRPAFQMLEILLTLSIVFDTVIQIDFQGVKRFFCGPSANDSYYEGNYLAPALLLFVNYLQVMLCIFCITGMVIGIVAKDLAWEEDVTLALLLLRFSVLALFFSYNHHRSMQLQGGVLKSCCVHEEHVDAEWDVTF